VVDAIGVDEHGHRGRKGDDPLYEMRGALLIGPSKQAARLAAYDLGHEVTLAW
jgi:hypothetical protein